MPRHRGSGLVLFLPLLLLHVQLVHAGAGSSYVCPPYNAAKPPYVFEDEPAWGKSIMRRHLLETYNNTCKEQTCGLHAGLSNMIEAYKSADQVCACRRRGDKPPTPLIIVFLDLLATDVYRVWRFASGGSMLQSAIPAAWRSDWC